jgi:hypothetical protein
VMAVMAPPIVPMPMMALFADNLVARAEVGRVGLRSGRTGTVCHSGRGQCQHGGSGNRKSDSAHYFVFSVGVPCNNRSRGHSVPHRTVCRTGRAILQRTRPPLSGEVRARGSTEGRGSEGQGPQAFSGSHEGQPETQGRSGIHVGLRLRTGHPRSASGARIPRDAAGRRYGISASKRF